jgi:hypothetical protein
MRRTRLALLAALSAVLFAGMLLHANAALAGAAKPAKPARDIVYITKSGKKFHRAICRTLRRSKKKIAISRQDAIKKGYTPCKACNP